MSEYLWDRKIRVTVYKQGLTTDEITQILASTDDGLEEGFDRNPTQTGILKFEIDQELPIEFEVTKTLDNSGKNNSASLRIYNISEDTAKTMGHQMLTVKIEVAYRGMPLTPIFLGDVISASYKRGKDGNYADFEMSQSFLIQNAGIKFSGTFPAGMTYAEAVFFVLDFYSFAGEFSSAKPDEIALFQKPLPYGLSLEGSLAECLAKLLKPLGMNWHITQANTIQIFTDRIFEEGGTSGIINKQGLVPNKTQSSDVTTSSGLTIYSFDSDSGLIEKPYLKTETVTKRMGEVASNETFIAVKPTKSKAKSTSEAVGTDKKKTKKAKKPPNKPKITVARQVVEFKTLLLPQIEPKTVVDLISKTQENISGRYGILEVKYTGASYDDKWYCECVGVATQEID